MGWTGPATVLTLCSVWEKYWSGKTRRHRKTRPHWRSRKNLAPSAKAEGCEPGRRRHCWGLRDHSLRGRGKKKNTHSTSVDIAHRCFFEVKNSSTEPSPAADEQQPVFNTVIASSAERIDGPSEHAACLPNAQHSVLILLPQHTR